MNNVNKKYKGKSVSAEQKIALVEFMEAHPELQKGKFSPNFTHKQANYLWNDISLELNTMIGANKNAEKWRKCWIDMKSNTKTKNVQLKKSQMKTGGGETNNLFSLEPLDKKISSIIGDVSIFGQSQTAEPTVNFEGYNCVVIGSENIDQ
ncbi:uncharacterized protein LOC112599981 [Melanaphis sacchari]|uniref:uncharacterized protein LOC112597096 n=1 Tax=Melanaphis sacchari TaxID=742174 RepID=UPI000DC13D09|nr:uncharacterized protein LOC112597096 [Melanaphis sacchari]XP_025202899.1 uncharacterized protein LOC112599981 [Melanaphis sacchari]